MAGRRWADLTPEQQTAVLDPDSIQASHVRVTTPNVRGLSRAQTGQRPRADERDEVPVASGGVERIVTVAVPGGAATAWVVARAVRRRPRPAKP